MVAVPLLMNSGGLDGLRSECTHCTIPCGSKSCRIGLVGELSSSICS